MLRAPSPSLQPPLASWYPTHPSQPYYQSPPTNPPNGHFSHNNPHNSYLWLLSVTWKGPWWKERQRTHHRTWQWTRLRYASFRVLFIWSFQEKTWYHAIQPWHNDGTPNNLGGIPRPNQRCDRFPLERLTHFHIMDIHLGGPPALVRLYSSILPTLEPPRPTRFLMGSPWILWPHGCKLNHHSGKLSNPHPPI